MKAHRIQHTHTRSAFTLKIYCNDDYLCDMRNKVSDVRRTRSNEFKYMCDTIFTMTIINCYLFGILQLNKIVSNFIQQKKKKLKVKFRFAAISPSAMWVCAVTWRTMMEDDGWNVCLLLVQFIAVIVTRHSLTTACFFAQNTQQEQAQKALFKLGVIINSHYSELVRRCCFHILCKKKKMRRSSRQQWPKWVERTNNLDISLMPSLMLNAGLCAGIQRENERKSGRTTNNAHAYGNAIHRKRSNYELISAFVCSESRI